MSQTVTQTSTPTEERAHHLFSPSTLQSREACACYRGKSGTSAAAETGTKQHAVVETGRDDETLDDDKALAAAECLDYYQRQKELLEEARTRAEKELIAQAIAAKVATYVPPAAVLDLAEIYLPVDGKTFFDVVNGATVTTKSTTAGYVDRCLIAHDRKYAILLDWKFGAWAVEHAKDNLQGIAYVLGLFRAYPTLEQVKFVFKLPHLDSMTEHTFSRSDIPDLYLRVQVVVARSREAYAKVDKDDFSMATPMVPACNFCALIGKCPKVQAFACKVGSKFHPLQIPSDITPTGIKSAEDTTMGLRLAQVLAVWASAFKTQVTDRVIREAGATGVLAPPPGFRVETRRDRDIADPVTFKKTTLSYLTEKELEPLAKYTFGSVEEAIKEKAPRGSKGTTVEAYKQALVDSGAVKFGDPYSFLRGVSETNSKKDSAATPKS